MKSSRSDWDDWLGTLHDELRVLAVSLRDQFERWGEAEPEGLARAELSSGPTGLASLLFLRGLWNEVINTWDRPGAGKTVSAGERLLEAGGREADLAEFAREVASHAVVSTLYKIDEGGPYDLALPGWRMVERDSNQTLPILHELLLETDPTGRVDHLL